MTNTEKENMKEFETLFKRVAGGAVGGTLAGQAGLVITSAIPVAGLPVGLALVGVGVGATQGDKIVKLLKKKLRKVV